MFTVARFVVWNQLTLEDGKQVFSLLARRELII